MTNEASERGRRVRRIGETRFDGKQDCDVCVRRGWIVITLTKIIMIDNSRGCHDKYGNIRVAIDKFVIDVIDGDCKRRIVC